MTRSLSYTLVPFLLCLALAPPAAGQAAVEAGLGAARAATTAAPIKGVGKSISGLSGALDKALKPGQQSATEHPVPVTTSKSAPRPAPTAAPAPPVPAPNWEDAGAIETGLSYEDLVRRFGPPTMSIMNAAERSLTYRGKDGMFQVEVRDGVVASIVKPQP